jgi:hypothetical protein
MPRKHRTIAEIDEQLAFATSHMLANARDRATNPAHFYARGVLAALLWIREQDAHKPYLKGHPAPETERQTLGQMEAQNPDGFRNPT